MRRFAWFPGLERSKGRSFSLRDHSTADDRVTRSAGTCSASFEGKTELLLSHRTGSMSAKLAARVTLDCERQKAGRSHTVRNEGRAERRSKSVALDPQQTPLESAVGGA